MCSLPLLYSRSYALFFLGGGGGKNKHYSTFSEIHPTLEAEAIVNKCVWAVVWLFISLSACEYMFSLYHYDIA